MFVKIHQSQAKRDPLHRGCNSCWSAAIPAAVLQFLLQRCYSCWRVANLQFLLQRIVSIDCVVCWNFLQVGRHSLCLPLQSDSTGSSEQDSLLPQLEQETCIIISHLSGSQVATTQSTNVSWIFFQALLILIVQGHTWVHVSIHQYHSLSSRICDHFVGPEATFSWDLYRWMGTPLSFANTHSTVLLLSVLCSCVVVWMSCPLFSALDSNLCIKKWIFGQLESIRLWFRHWPKYYFGYLKIEIYNIF